MRRIHKRTEKETGTAERQDTLATGDEEGDHQKDTLVHVDHGRAFLPAHHDPEQLVCVCTAAVSEQYPHDQSVGKMGTDRRRDRDLCSDTEQRDGRSVRE